MCVCTFHALHIQFVFYCVFCGFRCRCRCCCCSLLATAANQIELNQNSARQTGEKNQKIVSNRLDEKITHENSFPVDRLNNIAEHKQHSPSRLFRLKCVDFFLPWCIFLLLWFCPILMRFFSRSSSASLSTSVCVPWNDKKGTNCAKNAKIACSMNMIEKIHIY